MIGGIAVLASVLRVYFLHVYFTTTDPVYDTIEVSFAITELRSSPQLTQSRSFSGPKSNSTSPSSALRSPPSDRSSNQLLAVQTRDQQVFSTHPEVPAAFVPVFAHRSTATALSLQRRDENDQTPRSKQRSTLWITTVRSTFLIKTMGSREPSRRG